MPASLNKIFLIGNLTRDPELRYLPSGQAVTTFTLAVNRVYTASTGEKKEDASFIRIVVWARRAEVCNEFLRKGSPVFVEGRLQSRSWEAPDGAKRSSIEVVANNVQFLGRGSRAAAPETIELPEEPLPEESHEPQKKEGPIEISKDELSPDEEVPF
ncbi:MAG: single-stranded DNA-binding protein [Candidatus Omnitrophica bacterium]|nr:single-stranded DNA-binding protein [Candidatus Omnitrophota bacterium]